MIPSPVHTPRGLERRKRRQSHARWKELVGAAAFRRPVAKDPGALLRALPGPGSLAAGERAVVEHLLRGLVWEPAPAVLELYPAGTGAVGVLPVGVGARRHVLLGPSVEPRGGGSERAAPERFRHDLRRDGQLPFPDGSFDAVVNALTVPYLEEPEALFEEAARVLRPGGLLAVIFTEVFDPDQALPYWSDADAGERLLLVEDYLGLCDALERPRSFTHPALPGAGPGGACGEVHLAYAERRGGPPDRPRRPAPTVRVPARFSPAEIASRQQAVWRTHECPFCGEALEAVPVLPSPWGGWDGDRLLICLSDACPKLLESRSVLAAQGVHGYVYRATFHPTTGKMLSVPSPLQGGQVLPPRLTRDH